MRYKSLEKLSEDVIKCKKCELYKSRNKSVPRRGKKGNKIIFVGEAPGAEEDEKGIPFCGRGGKLLRNSIREVGIEDTEVYITNLVKCRPPKNRRPTEEEIESCNKYLQEEIRLIKPKITVLLGKTAIKKQHEDVLLKEQHGKIINKKESRYLLTYHPAAILRNQTKISTWIDDLKLIKKYYKKKSEKLVMKTVLQEMKKMIEMKQTNKLTMLGEVEKEGNPFKVLIATILSSRTKDDTTLGASNRLFRKYKNPKELSKAKTLDIKKLIKPVAFYKTKSKKIKQVAEIIHKDYNNQVPIEMDELLELPLVGRKTANCVLVYGFRKPAIPVDVHVHRISNRLGLVETKIPEETEIELSKIANKRYWLQINEYFVRFGQLICKPINPKCEECVFQKTCKYSQNRKKNN